MTNQLTMIWTMFHFSDYCQSSQQDRRSLSSPFNIPKPKVQLQSGIKVEGQQKPNPFTIFFRPPNFKNKQVDGFVQRMSYLFPNVKKK